MRHRFRVAGVLGRHHMIDDLRAAPPAAPAWPPAATSKRGQRGRQHAPIGPEKGQQRAQRIQALGAGAVGICTHVAHDPTNSPLRADNACAGAVPPALPFRPRPAKVQSQGNWRAERAYVVQNKMGNASCGDAWTTVSCRRTTSGLRAWAPSSVPSPLRRLRAVRAPMRRRRKRRGPLQEIVVTATRHEEELSKVPISVTALTQDAMDIRGIKDFQDVARFTPGVNVDNSGTNNISIRGIASSGGAGTTGIYIDDTPIQIRALAFNPDDALPKAFDVDRIEVLRGPQGTLFGAGSEGGTVRYITTQPSLTQSSLYSREEVSYTRRRRDRATRWASPAALPLIDGKLGVRATVWYRRDGGWIDRHRPVSLATRRRTRITTQTKLWCASPQFGRPRNKWTVTPSYLLPGSVLQQRRRTTGRCTPIRATTASSSADPTERSGAGQVLPARAQDRGRLGQVRESDLQHLVLSPPRRRPGTTARCTTSASIRPPSSGPDCRPLPLPLLLDGDGVHLPAGSHQLPVARVHRQLSSRTSPRKFALQSNDPNSALIWTTGVFFSDDRQTLSGADSRPAAERIDAGRPACPTRGSSPMRRHTGSL